MNAPTPALVAPRPERLRLVGQRRQILAIMHQRLMFGMLVFAGIVAIIVLRILWLAGLRDSPGRKGGATSVVPQPRGILYRRGPPPPRASDARATATAPSERVRSKA